MTTGAPIYLVSACASGEEFVAAFRRYADKNGLFIPIAAPLPAGRRGRFAVTLKDGGVMVEGEADIVSSATTPSVLHGRVGMTLRFIEPDIKSKTVLVELEQARLAMKPQPPSVGPRPADVPAAPRPVPPKPAGRIDANNALAECVAIGNVDGLEAPAPKTTGPKFVVPAIPPMAAPSRPKSPSAPPTSFNRPAEPATKPTGQTPPNAYPSLKPPATTRPQTPSTSPPLRAMPPMPSGPSPRTPGASLAASLQAAPASSAAPTPIVPSRTPSPSGEQTTVGTPPASKTPSGEQTAVGTPVVPVSKTPSGEQTAVGTPPAVVVTPSTEMTAVAPTADPGLAMPRTKTTRGVGPAAQQASQAMAQSLAARATTAGGAVTSPVAVVTSITQGWDAMPDEAQAEAVGEAAPAMNRFGDTLTAVPQAREAEVFSVPVPPGSDSDTFPAVHVRPKNDSDTFPVTSIPTKPDEAAPEPVHVASESPSKPNGNTGKAALPPPRRTTNPQQPIARNPTPASPLPVVQMPRNPTPAAPAPIVKKAEQTPLPPVVGEPKPEPPDSADEPTDITSVPIVVAAREDSVPARPAVPGGMRKTVLGIAVVPDGVTVLPATPASGPVAKAEKDTALMDAPPTTKSTPIEAPVEDVPVEVEQVEVEPVEGAFAARAIEAASVLPGQRPPVIEEPSGDWTMVPGESGLTILPRASEPKVSPPAGAKPADEARLPTGDWTIARVEDSPDGWSEPSKVDLAPIPKNLRPHTGPPVGLVFGEKPLEVTTTAKQFEIEEATKSGLKVEVDASLAEDAGVDALASTQFSTPMRPVGYSTPVPGTLQAQTAMLQPGMQPQMQPVMQPQSIPIQAMQPMPGMPGARITPMPPAASAGSGSFPDYRRQVTDGGVDFFRDSNQVMSLQHGDESTGLLEAQRRKRIIVIVASAVAAVALGIVLLIVLGGADDKKAVPKDGGGSMQTRPAIDVPDAAVTGALAPIDAASEEPIDVPADAAAVAVNPPPGECSVDVTSTPAGAEVLIDKEVAGTTPAKLMLKCDVEAKLVVRKTRYVSANRSITPTAAGLRIKVALGKTMLSVKVTSSPPGASISLGGKALGVTPAVIKLPANEGSTLVISKTGFSSETEKITPKQNNQSVHATLKKKAR